MENDYTDRSHVTGDRVRTVSSRSGRSTRRSQIDRTIDIFFLEENLDFKKYFDKKF